MACLAQFAAIPEMPISTGRPFNAWYKYAIERVAEHVDELQVNGARALDQLLATKLASTEVDEEVQQYVPSKRLRGAQYRAAEVARAAESKCEAKSGTKRKREHVNNPEGESMSVKPASRVKLPDKFGLRRLAVENDWREMRHPLFEMFQFNRIIVDEYTYLTSKEGQTMTHFGANVRWVLSGTPPLADFADIKIIAMFLGLNLGIDDDSVGVIKAENIKALRRDRTGRQNILVYSLVILMIRKRWNNSVVSVRYILRHGISNATKLHSDSSTTLSGR